jgi:rRNA-processing protein FCF1
MKKLKLYIETSVWNFLISEDVPEEQKLTKELFHEIESGKFEIYISEVVHTEIEKAPQDIKNKLKKLIEKYNPIVLKSCMKKLYLKNIN